MNATELAIPGVYLIEPRVFLDKRGYFLESWSKAKYAPVGIVEQFVQDNLSQSTHGVVRGLHLQHPHGQGKLVSVPMGKVWDVAVDVRVGSPTFGRWVAEELSDENHRQMYIPSGFAHGFCVLSSSALFVYKCTAGYMPDCELTIRYDDPDLGIQWPLRDLIVGEKDLAGVRLCDVLEARLPRYETTARSV